MPFMDWFKQQDNIGTEIVNKMKEGGFQLSEADPCMLYKDDEKGVCIIIIYIDDMLIICK